MKTIRILPVYFFGERIFNSIGSILIVVMMLLVAADVAGRNLFRLSIQGTLEITEFMMVPIVYFTLAYTQGKKSHVRVDVLLAVISQRKKIYLSMITYLVGFVIFALITWQGFRSFLDSFAIREATDGLIAYPVYPAKLVIPLGSCLFCMRYLVDIVEALRDLRRGGD